MNRAYYDATIQDFLSENIESIIGKLAMKSEFADLQTQKKTWENQIILLKEKLSGYSGKIYFEFSIPRMGRRVDVILLIKGVLFVLEFKIGYKEYALPDMDQVVDYALDLKNFHETSHDSFIAPILIATDAKYKDIAVAMTPQDDKLLIPIKSNGKNLSEIIENVIVFSDTLDIDSVKWESGSYHPTPTIVEAAMALYGGHNVQEISRSDAGEMNLSVTSKAVGDIIKKARENNEKAICFVTGVPGAGKTLVGLDVAIKHINKESELYSVFLSGNGPLVKVLRAALAYDKRDREKIAGRKINLKAAMSEVQMFIQNVHHFRDDSIAEPNKPPIEHVALFDEAQRAWNLQQTTNFMRRKKNISNFKKSEPEFLISCLDRHKDWAVVVCLVGGGQEINTGEAGISEWIDSLNRSFPDWHIYISPNIRDSEYAAGEVLEKIKNRQNVITNKDLHLSVSMRSFRAENVSLFVKRLLDLDVEGAKKTYKELLDKYPIVLTRDLEKAKTWLKKQARGSERYGIIVSSAAERLKPHAIDVRVDIDPVHWFLKGKNDVRSSYYLEDVATEFHVQGLELDWACVTWDADFRYTKDGWDNWSFRGDKWQRIIKAERKLYQKNAYRVLLTRARQGMVIVVPEGSKTDYTRLEEYYDSIYKYLENIGIEKI
ncbi:MAG: DUF2075 domain-containing protein [Candidatus Goldiibacteriota bacterium]